MPENQPVWLHKQQEGRIAASLPALPIEIKVYF